MVLFYRAAAAVASHLSRCVCSCVCQAMEERYQAVKQHLQMAETRLLRAPEQGGQRSNGAELPAPAGKAARADPGTSDLRDAIGE